MGFLTIYEGERYLITDSRGIGNVVQGPRRIWLGVNEDAQSLYRRIAKPDQYLVIRFREHGLIRVEHRKGPCFEFENPVEHESVAVKDAVKLNKNQMLVVYKQQENLIERRLVPGPVIFVPASNEWFHEFIWHGQDPNDIGRIRPGLNKFFKLQMIPSQIYYDVRTNDDILIEIQLMLFYEINDVEAMLNGTTDPIADFIKLRAENFPLSRLLLMYSLLCSAVASDVIAFVSSVSYQDFLRKTDALSHLKTYSQLETRASKIGCSISNVVYRGYKAPTQLQKIQLNSIASRSNFKLNNELENLKNEISSFQLRKQVERSELEQEVQKLKADLKHSADELTQSYELEKNQLRHQSKIELDSLRAQQNINLTKAKKEVELKFLNELKALGVDINLYVKSQKESAISEEIRIVPKDATTINN